MKTFFNTVAGLLIFGGILVMAGSANDCDGACMETANTIGEMLMVASVGLAMLITGAAIAIKNTQEA